MSGHHPKLANLRRSGLADVAVVLYSRDHREMINPNALSQPHVRRELQAFLSELRADDPRPIWQAERKSGLVSGIDQVYHFFFDDHEFDASAIGVMLLDEVEVASVGVLMHALGAVLDEIGDANDDDFVLHPLWQPVREAARATQLRDGR